MNEKLIIRTNFSARGRLQTSDLELSTCVSPPNHPSGVISRRDIEEAVFFRDEARDMRAWLNLKIARRVRNMIIMGHFEECARTMIDSIERAEGWAILDKLEGRA